MLGIGPAEALIIAAWIFILCGIAYSIAKRVNAYDKKHYGKDKQK